MSIEEPENARRFDETLMKMRFVDYSDDFFTTTELIEWYEWVLHPSDKIVLHPVRRRLMADVAFRLMQTLDQRLGIG